MRHRIFANGFLHYFEDRQISSFDESLIGKDPNNPVEGGKVLNVLGQDYVVTDYREYAEKEATEKESHEITQDWFADVEEVKAIP